MKRFIISILVVVFLNTILFAGDSYNDEDERFIRTSDNLVIDTETLLAWEDIDSNAGDDWGFRRSAHRRGGKTAPHTPRSTAPGPGRAGSLPRSWCPHRLSRCKAARSTPRSPPRISPGA